jgi:multiple sugar transport system permease protein
MQRQSNKRIALRTLLLLVLTLIFIFPALWMISISFKPRDALFARPPDFFFAPIPDHYLAAFAPETRAVTDLVNSLIIAGASTALVILLGTPAAYALARLQVKRRDDILMFILASRMAPPVALIVSFFIIYNKLGLLNTHLGLILAYLTFNLSFYVWLMSIFFREIPRDVEAAANVDGYGPTYAFARIVVPLALPGIVATGVLVFIFAWNEFAYALLLGGQNAETLPVAISRFVTPRGVEWGALAAVGTVALVPVTVMVFLLHKYIVRGLSLGAVKG